jgi:hypothetical protein
VIEVRLDIKTVYFNRELVLIPCIAIVNHGKNFGYHVLSLCIRWLKWAVSFRIIICTRKYVPGQEDEDKG